VSESTDQSYSSGPAERRPPLRDAEVISLTIALTTGVWIARPIPGAIVATSLVAILMIGAIRVGSVRALRSGAGAAVVALVAVALIGSWIGGRAWQAALDGPNAPQAVHGVATLVADPVPVGRGRSVVVELDGRRYEALVFGSPARRLAARLAGETVLVEGRVAPSPPERRRRLAARHVVGRLEIDRVGPGADGSPAARAANRVRRTLVDGVAPLPAVERSLFLGLVIGDDRDQPDDVVDAFRESGLSHLTAVSGQNVAFVLVVVAPVLTRLRPAPRWAATLLLIGWFALLTRFEPSVLRAAGMATLSATAFWRGRQASPLRKLSLTVAVFHVVDPLLVWSVGWWLSVGATAGIATLSGPIARRLPGPNAFRTAASVSLAANIGVMPASVLVFGRAPLVALVANLLAVPVAGFVMVVGIPAGLVAGAVPALGPIALLPARLGTRWVLIVARLAAAVEPDHWGAWPAAIQLGAAGVLVALHRRRGRRRATSEAVRRARSPGSDP
jgi:competence protein ComEC